MDPSGSKQRQIVVYFESGLNTDGDAQLSPGNFFASEEGLCCVELIVISIFREENR